jgi:hypothetical protein
MKNFNSNGDWKNYNKFKRSKNVNSWTYEHEPMNKMEYFLTYFDDTDGICYNFFSRLDGIFIDVAKYFSMCKWMNFLDEKSWKMLFVDKFGQHS